MEIILLEIVVSPQDHQKRCVSQLRDAPAQGSQQIVRAREIPGSVIAFGSWSSQLLVRGLALQAGWLQPAEVDCYK
ncbi:MAG: hypothetical protein F6K22_28835 [Okeania sp. SIO2F4]|uniref:hypothetical protein n=1 Tax=Okeania sp. SIO2F4 TaxID=2607790 RepID=UPI00142A970D|nr:hypothetical protein [Okeania sp. SIO2F4]MDJ0516790.1 hypothetical protein [Trichodesmium sp. MO_231.B1]NES06468.1 hypothetical protein [Okeania sp. SIO2F4]